jgi:hypothetical protein
VYALGVVGRALYIVVLFPPTEHVPSDAEWYMRAAVELFDPSYRQTVTDTIWPPGTAYYLGALRWLGGGFGLAVWAQLALSASVPPLVAALARTLHDERAARVALVVSSLYLPFVDYFAYFLSEGPFLVCLVGAALLLVRALATVRPEEVPHTGLRPSLARFAAFGLACGVAASLKGQVLLPFAGWLVLLLASARAARRPRLALGAAAALFGALLVIVPLSARATRLHGGVPTLISSNAGAAVIVGHWGPIRRFRFVEARTGSDFWVSSAVAIQHGYQGEQTFPFALHDSRAALRAVAERAAEHPGAVLAQSLGNVLDLFLGGVPWPAVELRGARAMRASELGFALVILLPALLRLWRRRAALLDLRAGPTPEQVLAVPILGLLATAFLTHGEPRYRIPFDAIFLVLAAPELASAANALASRLAPDRASQVASPS